MGVEYRNDRKKWGYRTYLHGKTYKKEYRWKTREEAERAYRQAQAQVEAQRPLPTTTLQGAAEQYLVWLGRHRSPHRFSGVRYNLRKWILPAFNPTASLTSINPQQIETFLQAHLERGVTRMTVWHYIKDLNAFLNWCIRNGLLDKNPVAQADRSELRYRFKKKLPLDPHKIVEGAQYLTGRERAYYNFLRFTGARRDEANRVEWVPHLAELDRGLVLIPGTKTAYSEAVRPIPRELVKELLELKTSAVGQYAFGTASQGKKIYDRRRLFAKVSRGIGTRITAKDLRDWFGSQIVSRTANPQVIMEAMRHRDLRTTTHYMRQFDNELRDVIEELGNDMGAVSGGGQASQTGPLRPMVPSTKPPPK